MRSRECVCGCDKEVPLPLTGVNADARTVQMELLEWDRARHFMLALSNKEDSEVSYHGQLDPFIDAGAEHYQAMLRAIHGDSFLAEPIDSKAVRRWIKFSRKNRKKMGRGTHLVRPERVLTPQAEDLENLNGLYPELSFTGPDPDGRKFAEQAEALEGGGEVA